MKNKYNITLEDETRILAAQGGHCALCERTTHLGIDHCHKTGYVRGILCRRCNTHIAKAPFGDDILGAFRVLQYMVGRA